MAYQHESNLQEQVAQYIRLQYPGIIFRSDFAAGIKMTMGQATKHKRMQQGRAYPDLFVAKPIIVNLPESHLYYGMYLELKHSGAHNLPYLKDGKLSTEKHIQEQAETLSTLSQLGYYARFAVGFDQAKAIIDWYLGGGHTHPPAHNNGNEVKKDDNPF